MSCAIRVPGMASIYFVTEPPDDREDFEIEEGAWIEIPVNNHLWTKDSPLPDPVLCRSREDEHHYKLYKYRNQAEDEYWEDTGCSFGGTFSKRKWESFAKRLPAFRALFAVPDGFSLDSD